MAIENAIHCPSGDHTASQMLPKGPTRLKLDPSALATYTEWTVVRKNGPFAAATASCLLSGDQLAESKEKTTAVVFPGGVSLVSRLPSALTTNASCGALSLVSSFASGRKKRILLPSGEDWIGKSAAFRHRSA